MEFFYLFMYYVYVVYGASNSADTDVKKQESFLSSFVCRQTTPRLMLKKS